MYHFNCCGVFTWNENDLSILLCSHWRSVLRVVVSSTLLTSYENMQKSVETLMKVCTVSELEFASRPLSNSRKDRPDTHGKEKDMTNRYV